MTTDIEKRLTTMRSRMRRQANSGTFDGQSPGIYFERCRHIDHLIGFIASLTRDVGYHSCGWWKNPDYERCYHLSLSFFDPETHEHTSKNESLTATLLKLLFGDDVRLLWCEPPCSDEGKRWDVWHYRLFCDAGWQPLKPRGEVYSRELTEAGWKSYSDVQAAHEIDRLRKMEGVAGI